MHAIKLVAGALLLLLAGYATSHVVEGTGYPGPTVHTVEIVGFEFVPDKIIVKVGDTVRWINKDIAPHTATSADTEVNEAWDSGRLNQFESWSFTAKSAGETTYICSFHPLMTGSITVKPK